MRVTLSILSIILGLTPLLHAGRGAFSDDSNVQPEVHISGELRDREGNVFAVDNITIGSSTTTRNIHVFLKPHDESTDPHINTASIDLSNISRIDVAGSEHKTTIYRYRNVDYVALTIRFRGEAQSADDAQYLIEANRELFCATQAGSVKVPKTLRMSAVESVIIQGTRRDEVAPTPKPQSPQAERKALQCERTAKALDELSKTTESMPEEQKGVMQGLVDSVRDWVGGMCST